MASNYDDEFDNMSDNEEVVVKPNPTVSVVAPVPTAAVPTPVPAVIPMPIPVPTPVPVPIPGPSPMPVASPTTSAQSEMERAVQAALDSGMWKKHFDTRTGKPYYFHAITKATTWDLAEELGFKKKDTVPLVRPNRKSLSDADSSSIVSPSEQPLVIKLPEKYRSPRTMLSEASGETPPSDVRRDSDGDDDGYARDHEAKSKGAEGQSGYQQLSRFQAFGSISTAAEVPPASAENSVPGKDQEDQVKNDSLGSEPPLVKVQSARRAADARAGFASAMAPKQQRPSTTDRAFNRSPSPTSQVSDAPSHEDPLIARTFSKYNAFQAFTSGDERGESLDRRSQSEQRDDERFPSKGDEHNATAAPAAGPAPSGSAGAAAATNGLKPESDSSSMFSTASQAIAKVKAPAVAAVAAVTPAVASPMVFSPVLVGSIAGDTAAKTTTAGGMGTLPGAAINSTSPSMTPAAAVSISPSSGVPKLVIPSMAFQPYVVPSKSTSGEASPALVSPAQPGGSLAMPFVPVASPTSGIGYQGYATAGGLAAVDNSAARIAEIRETTEAVERLVRAFAHLRGVEPTALVRDTDPDRHRDNVNRMSTNRGISRINSYERPMYDSDRRGGTTGYPTSATRTDAVDQQNLLEGAIVDCVLDMLAQDQQRRLVQAVSSAKRPSGTGGNASRVEQQHETVTVRDYRAYTTVPLQSGLRQGGTASSQSGGGRYDRYDPYRVFDSQHNAFTTWRSSNGASSLGEGEMSLGALVEEALNKYVLRHLVQRTLFPPLVRLLLLDLMYVCIQASVHCFGSDDNSVPNNMVLIRYDGPEKDCALAAQIVHTLPFEALSSTSTTSSGGMGRDADGVQQSSNNVFRLEHWVTKLHMWVVITALQQSLRRAEAIEADGYRTFSPSAHGTKKPTNRRQHKSSEALNERENNEDSDLVFIPQETALFSLLSDPTSTSLDAEKRSESTLESATVSNAQKSPATIQKPSSSATLNDAVLAPLAEQLFDGASLLTENPVFDLRDEAYVFDLDKRECFVETVSELLMDPDIKAAVEKRAATKLMGRALRRKEDKVGASAMQQTEQHRREEQMAILRDAEARAARMVEEIRAELSLSLPGGTVKAARGGQR